MKRIFVTGLMVATGLFAMSALSEEVLLSSKKNTEAPLAKDVSQVVSDHVDAASLKLYSASRNILAGDGHRETSEVRQLISVRTMELANAVRSKLKALSAAEERYEAANARKAEVLDDLEQVLLLKQTELQYMMTELNTGDAPDYYSENVSLLQGAVDDIDNALNALIDKRSLSLKAVFPPLDDEDIALLLSRLSDVFDESDLASSGQADESSYTVQIRGEVPSILSADEIEASFNALLSPAPQENAATPPKPLPEPVRFVIKLD